MKIYDLCRAIKKTQSTPTNLEMTFLDAYENLKSLKDRIWKRGNEIEAAIARVNKVLLKNDFEDMSLNSCGELQNALSYDMMVAEFMVVKDHVKTLMVLVMAEQATSKKTL